MNLGIIYDNTLGKYFISEYEIHYKNIIHII